MEALRLMKFNGFLKALSERNVPPSFLREVYQKIDGKPPEEQERIKQSLVKEIEERFPPRQAQDAKREE